MKLDIEQGNLKDVQNKAKEAKKKYPQFQPKLVGVEVPSAGIRGLVGIAASLFSIHVKDMARFDAIQEALSRAFTFTLNFALFRTEDDFQAYKSLPDESVNLDINIKCYYHRVYYRMRNTCTLVVILTGSLTVIDFTARTLEVI